MFSSTSEVFFCFNNKPAILNHAIRDPTWSPSPWRSQTFTPENFVTSETPKKENWEINPAASYIGDYMDRQYMDPYENQGWFGGWNPTTQLYSFSGITS